MALLQEKIIIVMLLFLTTWPFESIDAVGSKSAHTPLCRKNQSYPIHSTALVNKISVHVNDAGALDTERSRCSLPLCGLPLSPTPHTRKLKLPQESTPRPQPVEAPIPTPIPHPNSLRKSDNMTLNCFQATILFLSGMFFQSILGALDINQGRRRRRRLPMHLLESIGKAPSIATEEEVRLARQIDRRIFRERRTKKREDSVDNKR